MTVDTCHRYMRTHNVFGDLLGRPGLSGFGSIQRHLGICKVDKLETQGNQWFIFVWVRKAEKPSMFLTQIISEVSWKPQRVSISVIVMRKSCLLQVARLNRWSVCFHFCSWSFLLMKTTGQHFFFSGGWARQESYTACSTGTCRNPPASASPLIRSMYPWLTSSLPAVPLSCVRILLAQMRWEGLDGVQ